MSRSWHAVLAAAAELVPTARLSCIYEVEDEQEEAVGQMGGALPCPACSHNACGKLRAATEQLQLLSPRTLRVRLEGFDWSLVRGHGALWAWAERFPASFASKHLGLANMPALAPAALVFCAQTVQATDLTTPTLSLRRCRMGTAMGTTNCQMRCSCYHQASQPWSSTATAQLRCLLRCLDSHGCSAWR